MSEMTTALSTTQKLLLLETAIAQPFTTKSALIAHLSSRYPQIAPVDIEAFLDNLVNFEAVQQFKSLQEATIKSDTQEQVEEEELSDTNTDNTNDINTEMNTDDAEVDSPEITQSRPDSHTSSAEPPIVAPTPPIVAPSPPLLVPARTPSGRTLRSNSTVNTSEPRRLRSNK